MWSGAEASPLVEATDVQSHVPDLAGLLTLKRMRSKLGKALFWAQDYAPIQI